MICLYQDIDKKTCSIYDKSDMTLEEVGYSDVLGYMVNIGEIQGLRLTYTRNNSLATRFVCTELDASVLEGVYIAENYMVKLPDHIEGTVEYCANGMKYYLRLSITPVNNDRSLVTFGVYCGGEVIYGKCDCYLSEVYFVPLQDGLYLCINGVLVYKVDVSFNCKGEHCNMLSVKKEWLFK